MKITEILTKFSEAASGNVITAAPTMQVPAVNSEPGAAP
jgi:hypothetical protein